MKFVVLFFFFNVLIFAQTTRTKILMGTYASITLEERLDLIQEGFEIISEIENSLSTYKNTSTTELLNTYKWVKLDTHTYEALSLSKKYYDDTHGYFNIAVGGITKNLYHFGEDKEFIPHGRILDLANTNIKGIHFNKHEASLDKNIKIDFGGMGKGYAVDKVKAYYLKQGIKKAQIALSGDIACIGRCRVGVQNPFKEDSVLFEFKSKHHLSAISTSGTYNRYVKNQKNNHLIDPHTNKPQASFSSITLVSTLSNADLDAYATAASVMPIQMSIKFLDALDLAYIVITNNKQIRLSKNHTAYFDLLLNDNVKQDQHRYIYNEQIKSNKTKNF